MSENGPAKAKPRPRRRGTYIALFAAALAIAIAVWVSNGGRSPFAPAGAQLADLAAACPNRPDLAAALDAAAQGELAALNPTASGRGFADLAFQNAAGAPMTLKDFAGKALLVNFWASWCVPCREEMPALNALASRHNDAEFEVVALNLDIGAAGLAKAKDFLAAADWPHLALYADPSFAIFDRIKQQGVTIGLPATILLDARGCELAALQGPAHWDTPDGDRVIRALKQLVV